MGVPGSLAGGRHRIRLVWITSAAVCVTRVPTLSAAITPQSRQVPRNRGLIATTASLDTQRRSAPWARPGYESCSKRRDC